MGTPLGVRLGLSVRGSCGDCSGTLVAHAEWDQLTRTQCAALRQEGWRPVKGRGLCDTCHWRRVRADTLADIELPSMPREELLEEWSHFDYDRTLTFTANVEHFAERVGRTFGAMERALRRSGITAGNPAR